MQPYTHVGPPSPGSIKTGQAWATRLFMSSTSLAQTLSANNTAERCSIKKSPVLCHRKQGTLWGLLKRRSAAMWSNRLHMLGDQVISLKEDTKTLLHRKGMLGTKTLAANGLTCAQTCMCTQTCILLPCKVTNCLIYIQYNSKRSRSPLCVTINHSNIRSLKLTTILTWLDIDIILVPTSHSG